jgi:progressive ankylosis protein
MDVKNGNSPVTYLQIFKLWLPLAIMWVIMGIEQPIINAVIARMPGPKENLAAFGVTFAIALIIEAPIIQLLSAGTALSDNMNNYRKLLTFMHIMGIGLTFIHLILAVTPLYGGLLSTVMGIPPEVIEKSRLSFIFLIPWTAAIGYRRLWQGVLIRYKNTKAITITMIIRLTVIVLVMGTGYTTGFLEGAELAGLALSLGVISGALMSYLFVRPIVRKKIPADPKPAEILGWKRILRFYFPLALTSFITLAARPILTAGLGRAPDPLESLAAWPVINSLLFVFQSIALSYQEVAVSLLPAGGTFLKLKRFTRFISGGLGILFVLVNVTPLRRLWYTYVAGLTPDLLPFTAIPTFILILLPPAAGFISWYRGILVTRKATPVITQAVVVNSTVLALTMLAGAKLFPFPGAVTAAIAFTGAVVVESLFLHIRSRRWTDKLLA